MPVRVAINGFGRIGRNVFRSAWDDPEVEIVAINDLTDAGTLAHLLAYDSVHGPLGHEVSAVEGGIQVGGRFFPTTAERDPSKLPWAEHQVDVAMECTGIFRKREQAAMHQQAGAKKVIISAPGTGVDATIVVGVNDEVLDPSSMDIVSNASCTTNCLAPLAKVLDAEFGIQYGLMTTVHGYTMDQCLLDAPHKDLRRARAAALNIVPTTTGAAKAVGLVLPQLDGKLNGMAVRVPTPNVSLVDLVVTLKGQVDVSAVNAAISAAASGPMRGILQALDAPLVSSDMVGNSHSSIVDLGLTSAIGENMLKVISWYDNEWGFSCRMNDLARMICGLSRR